jgi:4-hydroxy-3-polyprenylbenzoate decarboxylase
VPRRSGKRSGCRAWHGYQLGDWTQQWSDFADAAAAGDWRKTGESTYARRHGNLKPETPVRSVEKTKG